MSRATCRTCGLPIPQDDSLADQLVAELRQAPASGRTLASRLHRRRADVMAQLHDLKARGAVELERPTRSQRSERWTLRAEGPAWEPHHAAIGDLVGSDPVLTVLALLAALVAAPRPWPLRLALGVGIGVGLVLLGSLVRGSGGEAAR